MSVHDQRPVPLIQNTDGTKTIPGRWGEPHMRLWLLDNLREAKAHVMARAREKALGRASEAPPREFPTWLHARAAGMSGSAVDACCGLELRAIEEALDELATAYMHVSQWAMPEELENGRAVDTLCAAKQLTWDMYARAQEENEKLQREVDALRAEKARATLHLLPDETSPIGAPPA